MFSLPSNACYGDWLRSGCGSGARYSWPRISCIWSTSVCMNCRTTWCCPKPRSRGAWPRCGCCRCAFRRSSECGIGWEAVWNVIPRRSRHGAQARPRDRVAAGAAPDLTVKAGRFSPPGHRLHLARHEQPLQAETTPCRGDGRGSPDCGSRHPEPASVRVAFRRLQQHDSGRGPGEARLSRAARPGDQPGTVARLDEPASLRRGLHLLLLPSGRFLREHELPLGGTRNLPPAEHESRGLMSARAAGGLVESPARRRAG
jgi:hypothetical protein